jgi:hypothetical protein
MWKMFRWIPSDRLCAKAYILNEILSDLDSSPFRPPEEFCVKLSQEFGRQVSQALPTDMQEKFESVR